MRGLALAPLCLGIRRAMETTPFNQVFSLHYSTANNAAEPQASGASKTQPKKKKAPKKTVKKTEDSKQKTPPLDNVLDIPWLSHPSESVDVDYDESVDVDYDKTYSALYRRQHESMSPRRKELSRERKKRRVIKTMQGHRFGELIKAYGERMEVDVSLDILSKLGRDSGVREYNAMIAVCVKKAEETADKEGSQKHLQTAYKLVDSIKEQGLVPDGSSYAPLIAYVANEGMEYEFQCLVDHMEENNVEFSEIEYFEMVLRINAGNRDEVKGLCKQVLQYGREKRSALVDSFLLALSENDWTEEVVGLLEKVKITQVSSQACLSNIFKCFGRAKLQEMAENCILALKAKGSKHSSLSLFICDYALDLTDMELEKVILIFKGMHKKLGVHPSSSSYNKVIKYCCEMFEVHMALALFEEMCKAGLKISAATFHPILQECERRNELDLVVTAYSVMHNYEEALETFEYVINYFVKMKNYEAAYKLLDEMRGMTMQPTVNIYNAIMARYFRENKNHKCLAVLKDIKKEDLKPDGGTYLYLIQMLKGRRKL